MSLLLFVPVGLLRTAASMLGTIDAYVPNVLWACIFSFLEPDEILESMRVNKRWFGHTIDPKIVTATGLGNYRFYYDIDTEEPPCTLAPLSTFYRFGWLESQRSADFSLPSCTPLDIVRQCVQYASQFRCLTE